LKAYLFFLFLAKPSEKFINLFDFSKISNHKSNTDSNNKDLIGKSDIWEKYFNYNEHLNDYELQRELDLKKFENPEFLLEKKKFRRIKVKNTGK